MSFSCWEEGIESSPVPDAAGDSSHTERTLGPGITQESLRAITGAEELSDVNELQMIVDTEEDRVEDIGRLLPKLEQLRFTRSTVSTFRSLGTKLSFLRILWASNCGLTDLDGIGCMGCLEELYISFNDVSDLAPVAFHDRLQILDLESNRVSNWEDVTELASCSMLWALTLTSNPVAKAPTYRQQVLRQLPELQALDDENVEHSERERSYGTALLASAQPNGSSSGGYSRNSGETKDEIENEEGEESSRCDEGDIIAASLKHFRLDDRKQRRKAMVVPRSDDAADAAEYSSEQHAILKVLQLPDFASSCATETKVQTSSALTFGTGVTFSGSMVKGLRQLREGSEGRRPALSDEIGQEDGKQDTSPPNRRPVLSTEVGQEDEKQGMPPPSPAQSSSSEGASDISSGRRESEFEGGGVVPCLPSDPHAGREVWLLSKSRTLASLHHAGSSGGSDSGGSVKDQLRRRVGTWRDKAAKTRGLGEEHGHAFQLNPVIPPRGYRPGSVPRLPP